MARGQLGAVPAGPNDAARHGDKFDVPAFSWTTGQSFILAGQDAAGTSPLTDQREIAVSFYIPSPVTINKLYAEVTIAGSTGALIRLGIRANTSAGVPGNVLVDGGTVSGTTVAVASVTLGANLTLAQGWYWYSVSSQGGASTQPTVRTSNNAATYPGFFRLAAAATLFPNTLRGLYQTGITGALTNTWTTSSVATYAPRMAATVA